MLGKIFLFKKKFGWEWVQSHIWKGLPNFEICAGLPKIAICALVICDVRKLLEMYVFAPDPFEKEANT